MLESVKISRRQSEIRQSLAELSAKAAPDEGELSRMTALDAEYRSNETRYRAALIAEDEERRDAGRDLETREGRQWGDLCRAFELRQLVMHYQEGRPLDGATAEVVQEMRAAGGYRGTPVPFEVLERRAGETVASGTPDPIVTAPVVDRLFPDSIAGRMGFQRVQIPQGDREYPVTTSSVAAAWATTETGSVGGPTAFATTDRSLSPDSTLGVTMRITRKAMMQSGAGLEAAIRRDMASTIAEKLDDAAFNGTGADGQPLGVLAGASTYGITETSAGGVTWGDFRGAIVGFMNANALAGMGAVNVAIHPQTFDDLDATVFDAGSGLTELDRMTRFVAPTISTHMPSAGDPATYSALLTTAKGGVPPGVMGLWGGIDVVRDPYTDAASGGLRLTALVTADVAVLRPAQLQILTGLT